MLQPTIVRQDSDPPSLRALVTDPYIIVAAGKQKLFYCIQNIHYKTIYCHPLS